MNGLTGWKRLLIGISTAFVVAASSVAQASPTFMFTLPGGTGTAGSNIGIKVSGDVNFFFGGDLVVSFDNSVLSYVGITPAAIVSTANVVGGLATITVTPFEPGANLGSGLVFDYFDIIFSIKPGASGSSVVELLDTSSLVFDATPDPVEYDVAGLRAFVAVQASNSVPIGGTPALVLLALAGLGLTRRRAGHPAPALAAAI